MPTEDEILAPYRKLYPNCSITLLRSRNASGVINVIEIKEPEPIGNIAKSPHCRTCTCKTKTAEHEGQ